MALPNGAFAPIPTPLDDGGLLDPMALNRHLGFLAEEGLDGVLVLGTNGEFPSFDVNERLVLAEAAARSAHGLSLMLGVGSSALPEVIRLVEAARNFGYQSVLLPPPFYFRSAPIGGLTAFFQSVLEVAELPILLYHIPQVTGIEISDEILDGVTDHPRFGGVKDSSGSEGELERFTSRLEDRSYMVGHDRLLSKAFASGGSGSITAAASVVPALVVAAQQKPERQPELDNVRSLLEGYGLGPAVKAILRHKGIGAYRTRPPLLDLDEESAGRLIEEFDALLALGK
jgi:4-hydroxy-tetrahydrodipicolinate synthase